MTGITMLNLRSLLGGGSDRPDPMLDEFFDGHYLPHARMTKKTFRHDDLTYRRNMAPTLGRLRLSQLTNAALDGRLHRQIASGLKVSTVNKHIFLMNRLLKLALHWGMVDRARDRTCVIARLAMGDYRQTFLEEEQTRALLEECRRSPHPFLHLIVRLLLLTGARRGEALGARWQDVDLRGRIWTVPVAKGGRSRRIVLSRAAVIVLQEAKMRSMAMGLPTADPDFIFINPRSRTRYGCIHIAWDKCRKAVGLDHVRIHDLRHTYASILVNQGVSLYGVQTLLGHSNATMTQRYAHLAPSLLSDRVELVSAQVAPVRRDRPEG